MVKKALLAVLFLIFIVFTNSCFIPFSIFESFSDINERRNEMNNFLLLDSLPPLNTGGGNYSFIVLTDTHIKDGNSNRLERLPRFIDDNSDIKFAVLLGDITDFGKNNDYKKYIEIASELASRGIPFYPVIGNHDLIGDGWKHWKNNIGSTNYRIDDENTTLIVLDSANFHFGHAQLDWLERELTVTKRDVFVFSHVPLFASGTIEWLQINDLNERARAVSILRDKCDIMFAGHTHNRSIYRTGNVDFITIEAFINSYAYCLVTVTDSGISYSWGKL